MGQNYYIDTCIWRDHYEDRYGQGGRPLGMIASGLFFKLIKENHTILFSEFIILELQKDYSDEDTHLMFNLLFLAGKVQKVSISKEIINDARILSQERMISCGDCLHAVLARHYNAILITQNEKDFKKLMDITPFRKPEQII